MPLQQELAAGCFRTPVIFLVETLRRCVHRWYEVEMTCPARMYLQEETSDSTNSEHPSGPRISVGLFSGGKHVDNKSTIYCLNWCATLLSLVAYTERAQRTYRHLY